MTSTDITCVLPRPDIEELSEAVRTELSKRLLGGAPVLPLSSEDILAFVMAGTVNLMHGFVTQALKEQDPATMCCDNLVIYAARHGYSMRGATRSKGYAAITGNPDVPIPPTLRFVGEASREYKLDPGVTFNPVRLDATGRAVVRIVSTLAGSQFDLAAAAVLTVATTTPGIDMTATVVGSGITGGSTEETCDQLRSRVVAGEASGVIVTNNAWYLQQALRYPGVTRVCTDECGECCDPHFVAIYPFMEGVYGDVDEAPYGVPPCDVLDEMTDWMFGTEIGKGQGLAPVGTVGGFLPALPTVINVTLPCFKGCNDATRLRIEEAMRQFIRATYCVGSRICKDELRSVVRDVTGRDTCFASVNFSFDDGVRWQDDAYAYVGCGFFPVLGTVELIDRADP
jgi:Baseplate J-like protein